MARLPDDSALGAFDAGASGRPIATYDTSGYARGAAAIGEGAKDLGAGIMTAGKGLASYAAQKAAAEQKLQLARGRVELTAKQLARSNAIDRETDPAGVVARHADEAAKEFEQTAQRISDPQQRTNVLLYRDGYVAGVTRAASEKAAILSADRGMADGLELANTLGNEALESKDPWAANRAADVYHGYVDALREVGLIGDAKAADLKRNWAADLAERALLQASAADRLAAVDAAARPVATDAADASAGTGTQPVADPAVSQGQSELMQLARMLPADVQARIGYAARAEVDRSTTLRSWEKAGQYEKSMAQASRGDAKPPPWRAAIEADPDLDDLTRTRLLKQHDAMQGKLDAFWQAKAEYDKPDGRKFNINDDKDREFVEQIYTRLGAGPAALHAVVGRTGLMPGSAVATMQGDLASNDPVRVGRTVDQLARLGKTHPDVLLHQENDEALQYALTQFRHETSRGQTLEEAIQSIIKSRSSAVRQNLVGDDLDALAIKVASPNDLKHLVGTHPIVSAALLAVYPELVKERLVATDSISLARAQALDQANLLAEFANSADGGVPTDSPKESAATLISPAERGRLHERIAYFDTFIGMMKFARWMEVKASIDAGLDGDQLIAKHAPGLNTRGQEALRQAQLEYFKEIPGLYDAAMADRAKYDAMPPASTDEERVAAATGYAKGSVWGFERLFGPTRFARLAMMSALRNRLPVSAGPAAPGPSGGAGVPQAAGWWQATLPAQALNNEALGLGMTIAGAPPLQPGQGAVADPDRPRSPPAAQPVPPSGDGLGLPPPLPVPLPLDPTQPVTLPSIESSTQSRAEEKKENEQENWGVSFFGDHILVHYDRDDATLGRAGRQQFFMPLEDSRVVVDPKSAYTHTGAAPSVEIAYSSGRDIYGVEFPLKERTYRPPTRADAEGHVHYIEGGRTAIRNDDGSYTRNATREYVTPGGDPMPRGSRLFRLGPNGAREYIREW